MRAEVIRYAAIMFIFGFLMPGVDNYAHAGGFLGGWIASTWLDPLTRERVDHLIAGLACLVLTAAAVAVSIITGLRL